MRKMHQFTAIIEKDEGMYVSLCPELDIASQGKSVEEA
jgi:predicted RNase H-like HicB family nuclease